VFGIIYLATNLTNGMKYVGYSTKTLRERKQKHLREAKKSDYYFHRSLIRYGFENFTWEIIDQVYGNIESKYDKEDLKKRLGEREKYWVAFYDSFNPNKGYNMSAGGEGGDNFTYNPNKENIRLSQSLSKQGKNNSFFGKKRPAHSEEMKGSRHFNFGKHLSNETREKIAKSLSKSIIQYSVEGTLVREWKNAYQIQREMQFNQSHISKVCLGKQKTAYGFLWRFKDSPELINRRKITNAQ
jgi:group I intron endonuclease